MQVTQAKRSLKDLLMGCQATTNVSFYDPLGIKVNSSVEIDVPDLHGMDFKLTEIQEYSRQINSQKFVFTDYVLVSSDLDGKKTIARLRANPITGATPEDGYSFKVLLLAMDYNQAYDKGLETVIQEAEANGEWNVSLDGEEDGLAAGEHMEMHYERCEGLTKTMVAKVSTAVYDEHGKTKEEDIKNKSLKYWDFVRLVENEGKVTVPEFYFIEMDSDSGWITMWRGGEVDPSSVKIV